MAEQDFDAKQIEARVLDLREAMDRVKRAQADRDDVVVEMKQAARARLELLAQDLQPVFTQVPEENERFEFALSTGETPRLWIDMTSHVRMGRDRRTYEFVKDTRLGRVVLAQTESRDTMARCITDYVAERILEHERAVEGEWQAMKGWNFERQEAGAPAQVPAAARDGSSGWLHIVTFLLGMVAAAIVLVSWALYASPPGL